VTSGRASLLPSAASCFSERITSRPNSPGENQAVADADGRSCPPVDRGYHHFMAITLEIDEQTLGALPLGPGERERHMQIELACRYYAKRWLSFGQAARMAALDQFAFAGELAERGIPRNFTTQDALEDLADAGRQ